MEYQFVKSKFDEKRPFDVVRAEDFGGDLYQFYEPLESLVRRVSGVDIKGSRPVFLIGGRGTGKTMVLKFLGVEMQLADFIQKNLPGRNRVEQLTSAEMLMFLESRNFVGVYLRFRTTEYDPITGDLSPLFLPYLSLKIAQQILIFLLMLKTSGVVDPVTEESVARLVGAQIAGRTPYQPGTFKEALELIEGTMLPWFEIVFQTYSYCSLEDIRNDVGIPVVIWKNLIFGLPNRAFSQIDCLRDKSLFVLLDELEFLNDYQKRCVGQLIKDSDETYVVFKIGSRYMPPSLPVGQSAEVLQEPDDFRTIDITAALNAARGGPKYDYRGLVKNILNRRLRRSATVEQHGTTDVEELLPNVSIEQEAKDLVADRRKHWDGFTTYLRRTATPEESDAIVQKLEFLENPLIEKLNMLVYYRGEPVESIRRMQQEYLR